MLYKRSLEIEQRLRLILELIGTGKYSTPRLADKIGVSIPTISRDVQALRERGHDIQAERRGDGWKYVIEPPIQQREHVAGNRRRAKRKRPKPR